MDRLTQLFSLVLVLACGPTAPGDTSATASSVGWTGDGDDTSGQVTEPATTAPLTTTSSNATTGDVTGTTSTGSTTSSATSADSTSSTTGEPPPPPPPPCVPETDWNEPHFDCLVDWPASTQLQSIGPAAPLGVVTKIFFGVLDQGCIEGLELEPMPVGDPIMPEAVLYKTVAECGPEQWPGTYDLEGRLTDDTPFFTTMTIEGFAGDWLAPDPVDPPRIFGTFSGDLVGSFEAVHCAAVDVFINNCG